MITVHIGRHSDGRAAARALADLYSDSAQILRDALADGVEFTTGWDCRRNGGQACANITREDGHILIEVDCRMADLWESDELINDALNEVCDHVEDLSPDMLESIRSSIRAEVVAGGSIDDHTERSESLHDDASLEEVVAAVARLERDARAENRVMYDRLCGIAQDVVRDHVQTYDPETATLLAVLESGDDPNADDYSVERLYRTANDGYFLACAGRRLSLYAQREGRRIVGGGSEIQLLSEDEAKTWLRMYGLRREKEAT